MSRLKVLKATTVHEFIEMARNEEVSPGDGPFYVTRCNEMKRTRENICTLKMGEVLKHVPGQSNETFSPDQCFLIIQGRAAELLNKKFSTSDPSEWHVAFGCMDIEEYKSEGTHVLIPADVICVTNSIREKKQSQNPPKRLSVSETDCSVDRQPTSRKVKVKSVHHGYKKLMTQENGYANLFGIIQGVTIAKPLDNSKSVNLNVRVSMELVDNISEEPFILEVDVQPKNIESYTLMKHICAKNVAIFNTGKELAGRGQESNILLFDKINDVDQQGLKFIAEWHNSCTNNMFEAMENSSPNEITNTLKQVDEEIANKITSRCCRSSTLDKLTANYRRIINKIVTKYNTLEIRFNADVEDAMPSKCKSPVRKQCNISAAVENDLHSKNKFLDKSASQCQELLSIKREDKKEVVQQDYSDSTIKIVNEIKTECNGPHTLVIGLTEGSIVSSECEIPKVEEKIIPDDFQSDIRMASPVRRRSNVTPAVNNNPHSTKNFTDKSTLEDQQLGSDQREDAADAQQHYSDLKTKIVNDRKTQGDDSRTLRIGLTAEAQQVVSSECERHEEINENVNSTSSSEYFSVMTSVCSSPHAVEALADDDQQFMCSQNELLKGIMKHDNHHNGSSKYPINQIGPLVSSISSNARIPCFSQDLRLLDDRRAFENMKKFVNDKPGLI